MTPLAIIFLIVFIIGFAFDLYQRRADIVEHLAFWILIGILGYRVLG